MELKILEKILQETAPGPKLTFTVLHLLKAIMLMGREGPLGRKSLSDKLPLGTGAVRTLIQRLRDHQLISEDRQGCRLTERGLKLYSTLVSRISQPVVIDAGRLALDKWNVALLVHNAAHKIGAGLEQRDAAVRAGATGANSIIYSGGKFIIPRGSLDCATDFPNTIWDRLKATLMPKDGDVIIVAGGSSRHAAEDGTLAAAWTLMAD